MNLACQQFSRFCLDRLDFSDFDVLEVGARNINGSLQGLVGSRCRRYLGIDIEEGPGVDIVCDVSELIDRFGADRFDLIVCTEVVEHVADWRSAFQNMKAVLKPGGHLLLTTRSKGFGYHGYPFDFWRFELEDMRCVFADFELVDLQPDPEMPGVFVFAQKPVSEWCARDLADIELYSVLYHRRVLEIPGDWMRRPAMRRKLWLLKTGKRFRNWVPLAVRDRVYTRVFK